MRIGIIGGAGYTAGELLRLLINHPQADIRFIASESNAGAPVTDIHTGLLGETDMRFTDSYGLQSVDLIFMCQAHGRSLEFLSRQKLPEGLRIIDLAQDFRDESAGFVYGLPELNRHRITGATRIANPGCFATAIQLSILPLADSGLLRSDIHVTALTGSTGAGVKPAATTHFSWRSDNVSVYKAFTHQHLAEIGRTVAKLQPDFEGEINFVPMRGDFARGIFASVYTDCDLCQEQIDRLYADFYADSPFAVYSTRPIDLKQAVNTNKAIIHAERHGSKIHITTAIDNLLKGASGQAVENMNLMYGLDETLGLRLKPSAF